MIFGVGLSIRLLGSVRTYFVFDERLWMKAADKVSFLPSALHLPLHGVFHPPFEIYLVKFSQLMLPRFLLTFLADFQFERLQTRFLHLLLSTGTVIVIYLLVKEGYGKRAALFASALVASCQFHIHFSRTVIQTAPLLFFVTLSLLFFWKSVKQKDGKLMLLTGAILGIAYLCEETAAFFLLIFFIHLLLSGDLLPWLKRWQTYAGLIIFLAIISPDLYWNLTANKSDIAFHVSRALRFNGISLLPSSLFVGELLLMLPKDLEVFIGGFGRHAIWSLAYPTVHWVLGSMCIIAVIFSLKRWKDPFTRLMLTTFGVIFLFFTFAASKGFARNYNFWWASIAYIPAVTLTGELLSLVFGKGTRGRALSLLFTAYLFGHALLFLEIRDPVYIRRPSFLAQYYLNTAKTSFLEGRIPDAMEFLKKSLHFNNSLLPAHVNLAECYRRQGEMDRGHETILKAERMGLQVPNTDSLIFDAHYIRTWSIGPFYRISGDKPRDAAEQVFRELQSNRTPDLERVPVVSQKIESRSAFVDLKKTVPIKSNVCSVARTQIHAPLQRSVTFLVGADDGITIWLNGRELYSDHNKSIWFPDEDRISAKLNQGRNDLILCVTYGAGSKYGFSIRVLDEQGALIHDLEFEAPSI
jgi:hypothetical protein